MKKEAPTKSKFRTLKRRLGKPHYAIVGVLESLWIATQIDAVDGNIGKLSNEEIAAALEWDGDADLLIASLVETGWLDADPEFRLVVHDWSEHVPTYIKGAFEKHKKHFADQVAKQRAKDGAKQDAICPAKDGALEGALARPNLTIPNHTKPDLTSPSLTKPDLNGFPNGKPRASAAAPIDRSADIREVFAHYRTYHAKSFPQPHSKMGEWKKIADRLKDGYSVADLCKAIDGNHRSPFHRGENDKQKQYHALELIVRNADKVAQFIELADDKRPVLSEKTQRTQRAADSYLERRFAEMEGEDAILEG